MRSKFVRTPPQAGPGSGRPGKEYVIRIAVPRGSYRLQAEDDAVTDLQADDPILQFVTKGALAAYDLFEIMIWRLFFRRQNCYD